MLTRITYHQAQKLFSAGRSVTLCPCKTYPSGPFSSAITVSRNEWLARAERYTDHPSLWRGSIEETAWHLMLNEWRHCNGCYELGYYPHYYVYDKCAADVVTK